MRSSNEARTGAKSPGTATATQPKTPAPTPGCRIVVIRNGEFVRPQRRRRQLASG
jgi:hypothetical protein